MFRKISGQLVNLVTTGTDAAVGHAHTSAKHGTHVWRFGNPIETGLRKVRFWSATIMRMELRFKLRTLLIVIALISVIFGLQLHIQGRAKDFVEEVRNPSEETKKQLISEAPATSRTLQFLGGSAIILPLSLEDVFRFQRRVDVSFTAFDMSGNTSYDFEQRYRLRLFDTEFSNRRVSIGYR